MHQNRSCTNCTQNLIWGRFKRTQWPNFQLVLLKYCTKAFQKHKHGSKFLLRNSNASFVTFNFSCLKIQLNFLNLPTFKWKQITTIHEVSIIRNHRETELQINVKKYTDRKGLFGTGKLSSGPLVGQKTNMGCFSRSSESFGLSVHVIFLAAESLWKNVF